MENDDRPVGHVLTRREALTDLGAAGMLGYAATFPIALQDV